MTPALNKPLPEFEAVATSGVKFTPQAFLGHTVVLYFYPKDATPGCTTEAKQAGDDASTAATISTIGFGVGLVGIGVGTYLLLAGGGEKEQTHATSGFRWEPVASKDGAGLLLRSTW